MRRQAMLVLVAMGMTLVMGSGVALAAEIVCSANPCVGTPDAEDIIGSNNSETIKALAGNDEVSSLGGNDEIYGDEGNEVVDGSNGNDTIYGGPDGDGSAYGTAFSDWNLEGSEDSDKVYGGGGSDYIDAANNDTLGSVDLSYGGRGNDRINAKDGNVDKINCGRGRDTVQYDVGTDTVKSCEIKNPIL
jgi:Ca2+-binding RTX toxin-like protein